MLDYFLTNDAVGGLDEELDGDKPDDSDVDEGAEGLHLVVAKGHEGGGDAVAEEDGLERDDVG